MSPEDFLRELAGDFRSWTDRHLWVCGFTGEPSPDSAWKGHALNGQGSLPESDLNTYFSVGTFRGSRTKDAQVEAFVLVLDDISTDDLTTMPVAPTYINETSLQNNQVGFGITDRDNLAGYELLQKRLIAAGKMKADKSGNNRARYVRLPGGLNLKSKVIEACGQPFVTRLVEFAPQRRYSVTELAMAFGVSLEAEPNPSGQDQRSGFVNEATARDLRSALAFIPADERDLWVRMGHALKTFDEGDVGRGLWVEWSQTSEKWKPEDVRQWGTFKPTNTSYQAVFAEAQRRGWPNPLGNGPKSTAGASGATGGTGSGKADSGALLYTFAADLGESGDDVDELVEGVITRNSMSVVYGDSNSGKTFLKIDLGAAVARGINWFGRRVEAGMVVYLAAEAPSSVRRRLRVYQQRHQCSVPNFAIVESPVDLFDGDADTQRVITLVRELEKKLGAKCELIIGDTLARLSAGANENTGEDMSIVLRHVDLIRTECNAHFSLIHHCGKDAAKGARGWSGLRAATDTEIEVTADEQTGVRVAKITKQRDLDSKGEEIQFRLEVIDIGTSKWGEPITSCVVAPANEAKESAAAAFMAALERERDARDMDVLVALVAKFERRGERVSTSPTGPATTYKTLSTDPDFPKQTGPDRLARLLRALQDAGRLFRVTVRTPDRKWKETFRTTPEAPESAPMPEPDDAANDPADAQAAA